MPARSTDKAVNVHPNVSSGWIDVSVPLREGMVHWPSDPGLRIKRISDLARGDGHTLSELALGTHTGTHVDAPAHFLAGGAGVDRMPLETAMGRARILEVTDSEAIRAQDLAGHSIRKGERILFKTRNSAVAWKSDKFFEDYVFVSEDAARFLAERRVRLVGVDYLSVGSLKRDGGATHRTLLAAGVWLIEGLDLSKVGPGVYDLVCLPLRIVDADGSPARAFVRPVGSRTR